MSKKNFVSVNTKYYKHSNADGEMAHCYRKFLDEKNVISHLTKNNFGDGENIYKKYLSLHDQHRKDFFEKTKRNIQKDAITFVDSVLVFSLDQFEDLENNYTQEELQAVLTKHVNEYMADIKKRFGLEPIGFNAHLDEGFLEKNGKKSPNKIMEKDGKVIRNIHFHLHYYNFDFEKKVSPWRTIGRKELSEFQTLAAKNFAELGFTRGISKKGKLVKHLEKQAFLDNLNDELEEKNTDLKKVVLTREKIKSLQDHLEEENQILEENKLILEEDKRSFEEEKRSFEKQKIAEFSLINEIINDDMPELTELYVNYQKTPFNLRGILHQTIDNKIDYIKEKSNKLSDFFKNIFLKIFKNNLEIIELIENKDGVSPNNKLTTRLKNKIK